MRFCTENNIIYTLLISISIIILGVLYYVVTSNLKEGLDKTGGLVDFANLDPNIKPEPLPDFCIGNGNFISQPNSTVPLVATAGYLHSNIGACENECTPERGCFAVSFDRSSKDVMKKCNIYSGASSTSADTIKAGTVCSRVSPRCTASGYKLNNTSKNLVKTIKPPHGTYFTHTSESSCANECNSRPECIGYLYDTNSKKHWKPCRIFSKNSSGASTGFPVAGICSRDKASASLYNGTWQGNHSNTCWHSSYKTNKLVLKANGNKITITPLDPKMLAQYGVGNVEMDGYKLTGDWKYFGKDGFFTLDGNRLYWMGAHYCWYEKISSSTDIPKASPPGTPPPPPASPPPGAPIPPPPPTGKCAVFIPGMIATYGMGYPAHLPTATTNCAKQTSAAGCIYMAVGGGGAKAPLCSWTPENVPSSPAPPAPHVPPPSSQVSGLAGNWHQVGMPTTMTISLQDAGKINGQPKIIAAGPGVVGDNGWGFLNTPISMFFKFGNGVTLPAILVDKNSSGQFNKIEFNNGAIWTRVTSSGKSSSTPPTTPKKPNTIIPVISPDNPRQKRINAVLDPIIGRGEWESPLPVAQ